MSLVQQHVETSCYVLRKVTHEQTHLSLQVDTALLRYNHDIGKATCDELKMIMITMHTCLVCSVVHFNFPK